jgi:hypothetical protein
MYRLTIHITGIKPVEISSKGKLTKKKIFNTLSFRGMHSMEQVNRKIMDIRESFNIATKNDKELIYITLIQ